MIDVLDKYGCELIVLVGYMRFVSSLFIEHFKGNVMNIHPALLPSFKGMHAHEDALAYGVKVSGVTVHFVDIHEDHGPIIIQKAVPVYDTDTKETLGPRILEWEHKAFPKAIELFCDGKLHIDGRIVKIDSDVNL
jgi:phosphoribosylglycinamide formyltransferase-1